MNNVNKTLYIPLRGKAYVSRRGIILHDPTAEMIWAAEGFPLKGKSNSKWLAFYMGMRAAVFDRWLTARMDAQLDAIILHIGCGMDSRAHRVGIQGHIWYDIDFPEVIDQRKLHYEESEGYRMLAADVTDSDWLDAIPSGNAIVVMEGVSMYLCPEELTALLARLRGHFESVDLLMDCYTTFAAKASRFKNPINDVGVTQVYGLDEPRDLEASGLAFVQEGNMTPLDLIESLAPMERSIFKKLYAGSISRKMYRLYEFRCSK